MGIELDKSLRDGLLMLFRYRQPDDILRSFLKSNRDQTYQTIPSYICCLRCTPAATPWMTQSRSEISSGRIILCRRAS